MKVAFLTLGCKVNFYDSEAMAEIFSKKGYEIVDFDTFSDIYVINTCTVTNFGDKKSRQMIRKAKRLNPDACIVATGCYSQTRPDEVEKIEGVNIVLGTKDRSKIVEDVEKYLQEHKNMNMVDDILKEKVFERLSIKTLKNRTRAYLKIQEGCNRFCSYCIIPYARGPVRSRQISDILDEVDNLVNNGFKEIVLTGIHVASYGADLGDISLIDVIEKVNEKEGVERIRLSSVEPLIINDDFINRIKKTEKLCHHFHLSLQSGCDEILKKMNRRYTTEEYERAVNLLRENFSDVSVTTDIIVGFPTENEEDFIKSCDFARKIGFSKIHVFPYSKKKGTKACEMKGQIQNSVKNERARLLTQISDDMGNEFIKKHIGKKMSVLFERKTDENTYQGHTKNYILVNVKSDTDITNMLSDVEITGVLSPESAEGKLVKKFTEI